MRNKILIGLGLIFSTGLLGSSVSFNDVKKTQVEGLQIQEVIVTPSPTPVFIPIPTPEITPLPTAVPAPTATDQGLSNDNYYINSEGEEVHSPAYADDVPAGATAICGDGTYSFSQSRRGTCSHHGGVAQWL